MLANVISPISRRTWIRNILSA
ncbi:MAG: hypothetical protein RJB11_2240, partial [Planctomycetota bacterium]